MKTLRDINLSLFCLFAFSLLLLSCDIIDSPIQSPDIPVDTTSNFKQNVLLEDYTGHTCNNCPAAAEDAHQLETAFGSDRVIIVAVHAGPFANPAPPDYPADHRTTVGTELDNAFRISRAGNPNGMVSRINYNGKLIQSPGNWAPATADLLDNAPTLGIELERTWSASTKTVDLEATLHFLEEGDTNYYLSAWITESGIIGDQEDKRKSPTHIEDYEFEHMLRGSFNGTWGDRVSATIVAKGQKLTKTLQFVFPTGVAWVPENCRIVVFVHKHDASVSVTQLKDVVQAAAINLVP